MTGLGRQHLFDPDAQIAVVLEYLARMSDKTTVVVCSGNHDLNSLNELNERAACWLDGATPSRVFVDGTRVELDGLLISVCAYWDGPRSRELVATQLDEDARLLGDQLWLWAYHAPPDDSPTSWTGSRHYGDEDLSAWIARHQPDQEEIQNDNGEHHHDGLAQPPQDEAEPRHRADQLSL